MLQNRDLSRVVLVANQKGGVGKSSIVAAVGAMAARPNRRVLIVDADQQGNVSRTDLGVEGDKGKSLAMALQYDQPLNPVHQVRPGLDVIPGGPHLAAVSAMASQASAAGVDLTENLASTLGALCARERYALVLIDSGPGDAPLLDALLNTARYLMVPSCDDEASLEGVELLATRYLRARQRGSLIELLGVVLFNVNPRATARNGQVLAAIGEMLEGSGAKTFETVIRTDKAAAVDMRAHHLTPAELVDVAANSTKGRLERLRAAVRAAASPANEGIDDRQREPSRGSVDDQLWSRDPSGLANDYQQLARELITRLTVQEGRERSKVS